MVRARSQQGDVNHITGDVHYLAFLLRRDRTVLTVHDLGILYRTAGLRRAVIRFFWFWLPVRCSRVVVAISETTRQALIASVRCNPDKVKVIYNGVSDDFKPSPKGEFPSVPRILHVGTGENKNLLRVAEALRGIRCCLIVIGTLSEAQRRCLVVHEITYENYVNLSGAEIVAAYEKSDLVVFASTFEGFGLPIIEAQAVGRPVITSNIMPMAEVAGDAACLVDPFSVESIRNGISHVIASVDYRNKLVRDGLANVDRFRLSAVSREYENVYRELCGQ
jgi:glycosyltransferase involved in cell wall biosynthesis